MRKASPKSIIKHQQIIINNLRKNLVIVMNEKLQLRKDLEQTKRDPIIEFDQKIVNAICQGGSMVIEAMVKAIEIYKLGRK